MNPKFYTFAMMINLFKKTNCYFYWFEKMAGFPLNERSGFIQFWLLFLGVNLTFFPMHFLGLAGMPRRIPDYPDHFFGLNMLVLGGSLLTAAGLSIFFQNILISYLNSIVSKNYFRQFVLIELLFGFLLGALGLLIIFAYDLSYYPSGSVMKDHIRYKGLEPTIYYPKF